MRSKAKDGGCTTSIWTDAEQLRFDGAPDHETDVCIVGAGIAGLTTAYQLVRQGVRVTVLDDGPIGGGETGRTSAHLANAVDDHYYVLEDKFGEGGAQLIAESHGAAIDFIEQTARELDIDCDFQRVDGYLYAPPGETDDRILDKELAAAKRAGLSVDKVAIAPLPFDTGPALRFGRQAEFHPLKYLRGLAEAIVERGGSIHTGVHVEAIEPGEPLTVKLTGGRTLLCRTAVDCTNGAFTSPLKLTIRQAAYRTYIVAFDMAAGAVPHGLYWDTADIYHYIRVAKGDEGREILIVGGNDHRTGQGDPTKAWAELEAWTRKWFPIAGSIVARWSGQVIEPSDGNAHIGKSPDLDHVFVCTGDSGNGLTHGTIAGLMIPDLIAGSDHRWAKIYDPKRTHLKAIGTFVAEAVKSAAPYTDWVRGGDVSSVDDIRHGEGAVVRRGLHMIATYRDEAGAIHERSATCTHLRGVVHWNSGEKTWDCPCHGSRFDAYGRVLNGPAATDLAEISEPMGDQPAEAPAERIRESTLKTMLPRRGPAT
ncbi:MAG: FAD-dependent oxidoreductase [Deltaproteobacteria bacterium]|nr:FAD-dependent oxidoreductase [Deltaproteobacteria bacterium]MDQ3296809.1 FAD-dependent oxidoreductase [Myxococcota bacterium]